MTSVVSVRNLSKSYAGAKVFENLDLDVAPGEFVAILGPSGTGKTTLFRCLTRLVEPDSGSIRIDGIDITRLTGRRLSEARRRMGVVFQQFNLVRRLSALDNVLAASLATMPLWRVLARRFESDDELRAYRALCSVGLADQVHQRADTLSGGQQQRVAIARAIAQQSRIILADEPVASLDPATAEAVLALLSELARREGVAVLATLHQPHLAERFADRTLFMTPDGLRPNRTDEANALTMSRRLAIV
jgi:phosphonate transport system ATP-binding protein